MTMSSSVPYLLRAVYDWILDNGFTPYLVVDAAVDGTVVPLEYVKDGQIVLNISPTAIRDLKMTSESVEFSGRFSGTAYLVYAPMEAILGVVAKENGEGMWFPREEAAGPPLAPGPSKGPPELKVVK